MGRSLLLVCSFMAGLPGAPGALAPGRSPGARSPGPAGCPCRSAGAARRSGGSPRRARRTTGASRGSRRSTGASRRACLTSGRRIRGGRVDEDLFVVIVAAGNQDGGRTDQHQAKCQSHLSPLDFDPRRRAAALSIIKDTCPAHETRLRGPKRDGAGALTRPVPRSRHRSMDRDTTSRRALTAPAAPAPGTIG